MRPILFPVLLLLSLSGMASAQSPDKPSSDREPRSSAPLAQTDPAGEVVDTRRKLLIGVRSDAPPFSYLSRSEPRVQPSLTAKSGPLRSRGYDGYMVYICDEVLKQMMITEGDAPLLEYEDIVPVDVDKAMMDLPIGTDRMTLLETGKVDILCDPATISRDRVRSFASSPPLFLTGISFLIRSGVPEAEKICGTKKALIGAVGTTNAIRYGVTAILAAGAWSKKRDEIVQALRNQGSPDYKKPCGVNHEGAIWQARTHTEVAREFCEGNITYYVGDLEIIRDSIGRFPGCEASTGVQRFTSDRYAIFADMHYNEADSWKSSRIARFFEVLNREVITSDSLLDHAFAATFGESPRSEQLDFFYWSLRGTP